MKIALIQEAPVAGDIDANVDRLAACLEEASAAGADLAVCTELAICAYPPRDLLDKPGFLDRAQAGLLRLAKRCPLPALVGTTLCEHDGTGPRVYNAAALLEGGAVRWSYRKGLLPTYDVFDEKRYFTPGPPQAPVDIAGVRVGVTICEDIWNDADFWPERRYDRDPVAELADAGAQILINLSASPFGMHKRRMRQNMLAAQAKKHGLPLVVVNQVGAHDDLIFEGGSLAFDRTGRVCARAAEFESDVQIVEVDPLSGSCDGTVRAGHSFDDAGEIDAVLDALVLGVRDYARKCGFSSALLGVSGGIDSALTAAIAAMALGGEHVYGVALPSAYSSDHSLRDAEDLAANLGLRYSVVPIAESVASIETTLAPSFAGRGPDVTEENIQARARGLLLMALSNKFGHLLLATGNKSEMAVGYTTLYGDMCGGLSVIADVYKTDVYRLAHAVNRRLGDAAIPLSTIEKAPSAELRPGQKDQDTLPPYEILDSILKRLVDELETIDQVVERGFERALVERVARMLARAEYKRYQAPPILKVMRKSFGPGWRMPLAGFTAV